MGNIEMTNSTDIAMLRRDIDELRASNERQRDEINMLKELDTKRMRAAVVVLGGLVVSLVVYIWALVIGDRGPT